MLIHVATDNDIHPPRFGGTQRTFGLCRGLARRHEVRVLCVVPNRDRAPDEERVAGLTVLRRRVPYTSLAWRLERARLAPLFVAAYGHRRRAPRFAAALGRAPDAVLADLALAGVAQATPGALRVHLAQNVEYDHWRAAGESVAFRGIWAERLRALEAAAVRDADLTVVCSEEDALRMRALYDVPAGRLAIAPNGWDETAIRPAGDAARGAARAALGLTPDDYAALFLASGVPHNRAALRFLVDELMPKLAGDGVRLIVAGAAGRALAGRREPWLANQGEVADLAPLLAAADAGLNPVTAGGGSNVKVPTYLAAGLAVLTTAHGLRGFGALRPHVTLAEPDQLADALRGRPRGWRARAAAPPAELAELAWGRIGERLGERLDALRPAAPAAAESAR